MKRTKGHGFIELERPLAPGINRVDANDPTFSDLAGVLTGMKPVTYTDCAPAGLPRLRTLCAKLKLKLLLPEEFLGKKGPHFRGTKKMVLLGRDQAKLKKAALAWDRVSTGTEWGEFLGYPACCAGEYSRWYEENAGKARRSDIIKRIFGRTKKRAGLDFRLNNVFNYFSRMNFDDAADVASYERLIGLNRELNLPFKHVVSWHPCSYDCAESARKAGVILSFMKHHAPAYAAGLESLLAKPVIFWDKFKYAFVDGAVSGDSVTYKAVAAPRSLLGDKLYKLLSCCDGLKTGKAGTGFYRKGKLVLTVPGPAPVLLDFR